MALKITKQCSLFEETVQKNGVPKKVHYIVKNTPFAIQLASEDVDFHTSTAQVTLISDNTQKEVEFLQKKPVEYTLLPAKGTATLEVRIKVLSTQLEGSLFVVKVAFTMKNGKVVTTQSNPIKSVSKPEQIRRKIAQASSEGMQLVQESSYCKKKRTGSGTGEVHDDLQRLLSTQEEHTRLLRQLLTQREQSDDWEALQPARKKIKLSESVDEDLYSPSDSVTSGPVESLELAFGEFARIYHATPREERIARLQALLASEKELVADLDLTKSMSHPSLPDDMFYPSSPMEMDTCSVDDYSHEYNDSYPSGDLVSHSDSGKLEGDGIYNSLWFTNSTC